MSNVQNLRQLAASLFVLIAISAMSLNVHAEPTCSAGATPNEAGEYQMTIWDTGIVFMPNETPPEGLILYDGAKPGEKSASCHENEAFCRGLKWYARIAAADKKKISWVSDDRLAGNGFACSYMHDGGAAQVCLVKLFEGVTTSYDLRAIDGTGRILTAYQPQKEATGCKIVVNGQWAYATIRAPAATKP